ncbi:FKBP-type peptidyl-prolyl cis-trans isomerase [Marivirga arenosa]|jgi:FKBP-type peptidyl-prolyl cis-trans isomerase|uniref:Peptidyl-prolyl cis-trans isomerase n=1 Tax=Marivirga arenosa TaxID=3059076 RepID=A0AA49J924_9BACT|nr:MULTISPECIES: FKBP-type peptidyl-prolyl cis-trans isomerase [unclassified Marivirga]WKK78788.2 FKBP-type peptidyl-prolyl cis-trans isomerase [Marivirga sp. BKB1-2]WMN07958.1 FKBP-type peptidyl-prolyl cis-trans isomerase [Marivirga sp. ABR2-2]
MNNYKSLAIALLSIIFLGACDSEKKETTQDGIDYVLVESENGESFSEGDFAIYSLKLVDSEDSVLINSEEVGELPVQIIDSVLSTRGPLFSILKELNIGDSIKTKLSASEVLTQGFRQPVAQDKDPEERLTVYAKALQKLDTAGFMEWQQQKREEAMQKQRADAEAQKGIDDQLIQDFLAKNEIEAEKTESGLYYMVTEEASGEKPEAGDTVRVNYVGRTMDGTVFDTSYEDIAKESGVYNEQREYGPIEIPIGKGRVIRGWDEGIMLLNEGSEATLYIPSGMAYGARAAGPKIPANSSLIFDVELVEVK